MRTSAFVLAAIVAIVAPPVLAQDVWQDPDPTCVADPGHRLVSAALEHLKVAAESEFESQRDKHLRDALDGLTRAFQAYNQGDNPAAWYALGRFYTSVGDARGADSTFRTVLSLVPDCRPDVDGYRTTLGMQVLQRGLELWQQQAPDSATEQFALARSLMPSDANVSYYQARMLAENGRLEDARAAIASGDSVGGGQPNFDSQRRRSLLDVARGYEAGVDEAAVSRLVQSRVRRDSVADAVATDSLALVALIEEWIGFNLRPDVMAAVQQDSTRLEERLLAGRTALADTRAAIERDSTALWTALGPVLGTYETYVESYADDRRVTYHLLRVAASAGATATVDRMLAIAAENPDPMLDQLSQAAVDLFNSGMTARSATLLERGLEVNGHHRTSLYLLGRTYYVMGDSARTLPTALRLLDVDPLNPQTLQLMAMGHAAAGGADSAQAYVDRSRGGLEWVVNVQQFIATDSATVLTGSVQNAANRALSPVTVTFEFLAPDGTPVATAEDPVPELAPGARHAMSLRVETGGAVAWRYRTR